MVFTFFLVGNLLQLPHRSFDSAGLNPMDIYIIRQIYRTTMWCLKNTFYSFVAKHKMNS